MTRHGEIVEARTYGALCAEFYDRTKPVGGDYADVPYYLRRLGVVDGPVLEAAVGTGRLLVPLRRAGLAIEGIDSSVMMLLRCRRNCADAGLPATLHFGALQTMHLDRRYAAIVVSFGSFMLLAGPGEAAAALDRMRRHLVPGGRLFLDVDAEPAGGMPPVGHQSRREVQVPDGSTIVLVDTLVGYDGADRIERHEQCYEHRRAECVLVREVLDFRLRRYERAEVERLLDEADFVDITACGDYVESTPAAAARNWLCFVGRAR